MRAWHLAAAMETVTGEDEQRVRARAHKALALQPALAALPLLMAVVGRARVLPGMPEPAPRRTPVPLPAAPRAFPVLPAITRLSHLAEVTGARSGEEPFAVAHR